MGPMSLRSLFSEQSLGSKLLARGSLVRSVVVSLGLLGSATFVAASDLGSRDPASSYRRLEGIAPAIQSMISSGSIPGAVVMVSHRGETIYHESFGDRDIDQKRPMKNDTIVRIYSMSKPVTSVAVLILAQEGKIDLDAPLSRYIPAISRVQVYEGTSDSGDDALAPLVRPITVRDLLRHTAGFTYGFFGNREIDQRYRAANLLNRNSNFEQMLEKLAQIPLADQPGSRWNYSVATDVCGHLVEVVSGQTLGRFFEERIFAPLKMVDTGFYVPADKLSRFATNYRRRGPDLLGVDSPEQTQFDSPPSLPSGGGGLVSTASDYMRFCRMMLNGGELDGARILRPETVAVMTSNQLVGPAYPIRLGIPVPGVGFGLGVSVVVESSDPNRPVGEYGWAGAASTHFWVSPHQDLAVVVLTQIMPLNMEIAARIRPFVYSALEPSLQPPGAQPEEKVEPGPQKL